MIIRVSELQGDGLTIDDPGAVGAPYQDHSWRLDAVHVRVAREGMDVLVAGEVAATVPQTCGRCLEPFPVTVQAALDLRFIPRPATTDSLELSADDFETDFYVNDQLDLGAVIESETALALPMKPLCRPDCLGLCPVCGGNRNVTACACPARAPDPRLAALRGLTAPLDH